MKKLKPKMNGHFAFGAIAVLGAVLMAGCTSIGPDGPARAQNDGDGATGSKPRTEANP